MGHSAFIGHSLVSACFAVLLNSPAILPGKGNDRTARQRSQKARRGRATQSRVRLAHGLDIPSRALFRLCLVSEKFYKIFQISRHIESLDVCMEY